MARVTFMDGIASVSGRIGDFSATQRSVLHTSNYSNRHPLPSALPCASLFSNNYLLRSRTPRPRFRIQTVDYGLRDHFATTIAHRWHRCITSLSTKL